MHDSWLVLHCQTPCIQMHARKVYRKVEVLQIGIEFHSAMAKSSWPGDVSIRDRKAGMNLTSKLIANAPQSLTCKGTKLYRVSGLSIQRKRTTYE